MTTLWVVGKNVNESGTEWLFMGIFDSEEKAVAACRDEFYFVAPETLNEQLKDEWEPWPGLWFPHLEEKPKEKIA